MEKICVPDNSCSDHKDQDILHRWVNKGPVDELAVRGS